MAELQGYEAIDFTTLDLSLIGRVITRTDFFDNIDMTVNGVTYADIVAIEWNDGVHQFQSFFAGDHIEFTPGGFGDPGGDVTGGLLTAYFLSMWDGTAFQPVIRLQGVSVSAADFYDAFGTTGTGDDQAVVEAALQGDDTIVGSAAADTIEGFAGNDVLAGNGGNDTLDGGTGSDTASYASAAGAVTVNLGTAGPQNTGGAGTDTLIGIENLEGSAFNDTLTGDSGDNVLSGGAGNDALFGGAGNDTASYGSATAGVTVSLSIVGAQNTGGAGFDTLSGTENLTGSAFADTLTGDAGNNVLDGGAGNDTLDGGSGNDALEGGSGNDTASYASAAAAATVSLLTAGPQNTGGAGTDILGSIENLVGSAHGDTLTGDAGNNALSGGAGNDTLEGGAGNDTLDGGDGIDTASYASAASGVTVDLAIAGPQATGGGNIDTLLRIEGIVGSASADILAGDGGNNVLAGGAGDDTLEGRGGNDTLDGGAGKDTASYASAVGGVTVSLSVAGPQNTVSAGFDTLTGVENLEGSAFADTLGGNAGDNRLDGGAGNDTASFAAATAGVIVNLGIAGPQDTVGAGIDTLISIENVTGSAFADTLIGTAGNNAFTGGAGSDTVSYAAATGGVSVNLVLSGPQNTGAGGIDTLVGIENLVGSAFADTLAGNAGNNVLDGGAGNDTASYASAAAGVTVRLAVSGPQNTGGAGIDTLNGVENLVGSAFADHLTGDAGANALDGGAGNDTLEGGGGNDSLTGGAGIDTASYASAAAGVIVKLAVAGPQNTGGAGIDNLDTIESLTGSAFADTLTGDAGNNVLAGGAGDDTLQGGQGTDTLDGGAGIDTASYASAGAGVTVRLAVGSPQNTGGAGLDTLVGIENVTGSVFADSLTGNAGNNVLNGSLGDDVVEGGAGDDTLGGGAGIDTVSYASAAGGVTVSLAIATAQDTGSAGIDTLTGFENLAGSAQADSLTGNGNANELGGAAGDDVLRGNAGNDRLDGGVGNDTVEGGTGDDILIGGAGIDVASYASAAAGVTVRLATAAPQDTGGAGLDSLSGFEGLVGSAFADSLTGDAGANALSGGSGNDTLSGGAGDDKLDGGIGIDTASYATATCSVAVNLLLAGVQNTGGAGSDTLTGIENLTGSTFADVLTGNGGANALAGGAGDDTLTGGAGGDALNGGVGTDIASYVTAASGVNASLVNPATNTGDAAGDSYTSIEGLAGSALDDVLAGNNAANTLIGNQGADSLFGNGGNDVLVGGPGGDLLDGGTGEDTASYQTAGSAVTASLADPSANAGQASGDSYVSIEHLAGSAFDDTLVGNALNNILQGGGGADDLDGGVGFDFASYADSAGPITVSFADPGINTGNAAGDSFTSIEGIIGSVFNDTLIGGGGTDLLVGGLGADQLDGGSGLDLAGYMLAVAGITASLADPGVNTGEAAGDIYTSIEGLIGSSFNDTLSGDDGDNVLVGFAGADVLDGGAGFDIASYHIAPTNAPNGIVASLADPGINTGEAKGDSYVSIEGLDGTVFADALTGDTGNNALVGNGGDDVLEGGVGGDFQDGGDGFDYASYANASSGVTVSLANPFVNAGEAFGDTFLAIEGLKGSAFDDVLIGNAAANTLNGNGGNDVLVGGAGGDTLIGGSGLDLASYATSGVAVTVSLAIPAGNTGDAAGDSYNGIEGLVGSNFADVLTGNAADNVLVGGLGADQLNGGNGIDTASYQFATAGVTVSLADPGLNTGEAAGDTYTSIEGLAGSAFADTLSGNSGNNTLDGGTGNDTASYAAAAAGVTVSLTIAGPQNTGGAGTDTLVRIENLIGSAFVDRLTGGAGDNTLTGGAGDDVLIGGGGADVLNGGTGNDYASYVNAGSGLTASLADAAGNTGDAAGDTYVSIERLAGSQFSDVLIGNASGNTLRGNGGADHLDGGDGQDFASYWAATTAITASLENPSSNTGEAAGDAYISIEGLVGSAFNDHLIGDSNDNVLEGQVGADILDGRESDDTVSFFDATSGVTASLADQSVNTGEAAGDTYISIENLAGSQFDDVLIGNAFANEFRGYGGADHFDGGDGYDIVFYDYATAGVIASLANPAVNTGAAAGDTYASIEELQGTNFGDRLIGGDADDVLVGNAGRDVFVGGRGNDAYYGGGKPGTLDGATDVVDYGGVTGLSEGITVDWAEGTVVGDIHVIDTDFLVRIEGVIGTSLADTFDATGYSSSLSHAGDFNAYQFIRGGGGDDTIIGNFNTEADYSDATSGITANMEFFGTGTVTGDGVGTDSLSGVNRIIGSSHDDTFFGTSGNEIFDGGPGGDDVFHGAGGVDTVEYDGSNRDAVDVHLADGTVAGRAPGSNIGSDTLDSIEQIRGSEFADVYDATGFDSESTNAGSFGSFNQFEGQGGADTVIGNGNTRLAYFSASGGIVATMSGNGSGTVVAAYNGISATDTFSGVNRITGGNFDDSISGAGSNDWFEGRGGADLLQGGNGNDTLDGGDGNDVLNGGAGANTLTGGLGNDAFVFDTPLVADVITSIVDFGTGADRIHLSHAIFTQAGPIGPLAASAFNDGSTQLDADDRILYHAESGSIAYDADGSGAQEAITFATVTPGTDLSAASFRII